MSCKLLLCFFILVVWDSSATPAPAVEKGGARQKRLLFYDEEGNLVKTYKNPYSLDVIHNAEKVPLFGSFYSMFRPSSLGVPTLYMIPVSDQVIQQINTDPVYQNKLLTVPRKELVIEPNTQCTGKRTQIPSKSCRNFLNCWDGWAFEQECPEGLLFAKEGYCDYPHNVDCSTRTNDLSLIPAPAQCTKDFEAFRSKQLCNEFFVCVDRMPVRFKCPADLAYNQELGVCDYAYRVNCGESTVSHDEQASSTGSQPNPPNTNPMSPVASQPSFPAPAPISPCVPVQADPVHVEPAPQPPGTPAPPPGLGNFPAVADMKTAFAANSEFNTQTRSSAQVALSRHDAIRQLQIAANP